MSKTQTQLISDLKHTISQLEALNNGRAGSRKKDDTKALNEVNEQLKKTVKTLKNSNSQYISMFERKNKQCLRLQSENDKLKELVESLKEEISMQGFLGLYEHELNEKSEIVAANIAIVQENEKLKLENFNLQVALKSISITDAFNEVAKKLGQQNINLNNGK